MPQLSHEQKAEPPGLTAENRRRPEILPLVERLIESSKDEAVPEAAILALGKVGGPETIPFVERLTKSQDSHIYDPADKALAMLQACWLPAATNQPGPKP